MQIIKSPHGPAPSAEGRPTNIFDFLKLNPNKVAAESAAYIRADDGWELSRTQLFTDARRLAHAFRHKLGLKPGDRVALFSPNSTMYPRAVLAGLCSGVVLVPMNPAYSGEEFTHPLLDAEVTYVLSHPAVAPVARKGLELAKASEKIGNHARLWLMDDTDKFAEGVNGEKDIRSLMGKEELDCIKVDDPKQTDAFVVYSSGTSGKPKGVQLTHSNMISVTAAMEKGLCNDFGPQDRHLAVLPMQHIFALAKFIHHAVWWGVTVVVLPKFDLEMWCSAVQKYKCTLAIVVPPILVLVAKSPVIEKYDLSSIKLFMCGAAPLSAELGDAVIARMKQRGGKSGIAEGFGLSETSPTATYESYKTHQDSKGSCGRLLPGVEARIVDADGKDVGHEQGKDGKPGELWLRGPTIMKGYLNRPDATADCIDKDGFFHTGDVAICLKGEQFYIVDRIKELIKYKGFQVAPAELEALLLQNPKVGDAACIGIYSDEQATEMPRAYVVPADASIVKDKAKAEAFSKEVIAWVGERVANHKKLRGGCIVIEAVPKSPSGKILRRLLRDEAAKEGKAAKSKL